MKTHVDKQQGNSSEAIGNGQSEFNFENWVKQVRPQLLASVQKRGVK